MWGRLVALSRPIDKNATYLSPRSAVSAHFPTGYRRHVRCSAVTGRVSVVRFTDSIAVDAGSCTSRAVLFVDPAADYLADHFPGAPTLPGLVMLEAAVRAAAALWDAAEPATGERTATLAHVDRLQVVRRVVPGETLVVETTVASDGGQRIRSFSARGLVSGETAMRARFRLRR